VHAAFAAGFLLRGTEFYGCLLVHTKMRAHGKAGAYAGINDQPYEKKELFHTA
jgi:hypothetical protein